MTQRGHTRVINVANAVADQCWVPSIVGNLNLATSTACTQPFCFFNQTQMQTLLYDRQTNMCASIRVYMLLLVLVRACTACTFDLLRQKNQGKTWLDGQDRHNLQAVVLSYLIHDVNLIYLTFHVGQWLVDTYRVGCLTLLQICLLDDDDARRYSADLVIDRGSRSVPLTTSEMSTSSKQSPRDVGTSVGVKDRRQFQRRC